MKKIMVLAVLSLMVSFGASSNSYGAGSIAHGNISVFEGGQLADKLSGQNPVEDGSLMVCDGKCMIKADGISLVATDQAKFAIQNEESVFNLYVRDGQINFVINNNSRKIAFHTPDGTYSVADVIFNAASESVVRGYVEVTEAGQTEIAVSEGRLVFATAEGMKTVDANHKIVLAVNPGTGGEAVVTTTTTSGLSTAATAGIAAGVVGTAVATGVVVENNNDDDDPPAPQVTPATPSTSTTPVVRTATPPTASQSL